MKQTIHFSVTIHAKSFRDLQKHIRALEKLLKEENITYSVNAEGAA